MCVCVGGGGDLQTVHLQETSVCSRQKETATENVNNILTTVNAIDASRHKLITIELHH